MILLDANVWRYLVDAVRGDDLLPACHASRVELLIAPSVVYEALRARDPALRGRLIELMTRKCWRRLMPEIYSESMELLDEIRRLRPSWLQQPPDLRLSGRIKLDWTTAKRGFWFRARHGQDAEVDSLAVLEGDGLERARAEAKERRSNVIEQDVDFTKFDLGSMRGELLHPLPGWSGQPVEPWRISGLTATTEMVRASHHPLQEWLGGHVILRSLVGASWVRLWLHEVDTVRMPRAWIRWAVEFLSSTRKTTSGTPCDVQLATYLVECDHFLTADKVLHEIIAATRAAAPIQMGQSHLLPAGSDGVQALFEWLRALRGR